MKYSADWLRKKDRHMVRTCVTVFSKSRAGLSENTVKSLGLYASPAGGRQKTMG
jgi:hypothetical protein